MNPTVRKNLITNLLIIVGFAVLAMLYAWPAVQGKVLAAHDNIAWRGISEEARQEFQKTGKPVLWSNSMFGGMPSYTFYSGSGKNIFGSIQDGINTVFPRPVNFIFLAMLSMYVLGLVMRINRWASVVGALAYGFATFFLVSIMAGHDTKVLAMAYMPAVLAGFFLTFRGSFIGGAALLMVSLALMCITGHYQILYYEAIIIGLAWIALLIIAIRESRIKQFVIATAISGGVAVLAVLSIMGSFLVTKEYNEYTMRGGNSELTINKAPGEQKKKSGGLDKEYAFQYSEGTDEVFTVLVPDLYGGSMNERLERFGDNEEVYTRFGYLSGDEDDITVPMYWGPQPIQSGPVYFGAAICFLFLLGMIIIKSPHKWWMAAVSLLAIFMSMGKNLPGLNYWLFDNLPMFKNFRTPAMILVIPGMMFPLVGAWGIAEIWGGRVDSGKLVRNILIAAGITAGLALLLGIGFSMSDDVITANEKEQLSRAPELMEALRSDRAALARNSGLLSAFYILLSAGLLWLAAKGRMTMKWAVLGIGLVVAIDLMPVAARYVNSAKFKDKEEYDAKNFAKRSVDAQILQDPDPDYRVLDVTRNIFNDAQTSFYHKSIGGYSPAKMEIYQDLIDVHMARGFNEAVVNMLNTKYIIVGQPGQEGVIPNQGAAGHAWFVNEIKWVPTADAEMLALNARKLGDTVEVPNAFDPKRTAVVRENFRQQLGANFVPGKDSSAAITLTKYGLNDLSYTSNNSTEGLAVFSEIWYPAGWKAFIDGKEVPILRANYVLRAIKVPAGEHKIEFRFRPATYEKGENIAFFASLAGLLLVLGGAGYSLSRAMKDERQGASVKQS